jgi:XrtJ-associated TM-motif-TM protein
MKKTNFYLLGIALLFAFALPAFGQDDSPLGSCVNSPENPTAILAAVGSAGALFVSVRTRMKIRRNSSSK